MKFSPVLSFPVVALAGLIRYIPSSNHPNEDIDIRLTETQVKNFQKFLKNSDSKGSPRASATGPHVKLWDENYDPFEDRFLLAYYFDENATHTTKQRNLIRKSFDQYGDHTCVKIVEVSENDARFEHKLKVISGQGCYSYIGRHYKNQEISLGTDCEYATYPIHEVMHALGFWHEHQRPDRDKHVTIHRNRTYLTDEQFIFAYSTDIWEIYDWQPSGSDYDINSITHYTSTMFSKDSDIPVLTYPGTDDALIIDNSKTFSPTDIIDINFKYACNQSAILNRKREPPYAEQPQVSPYNRFSDCCEIKSTLTYILLPLIFFYTE